MVKGLPKSSFLVSKQALKADVLAKEQFFPHSAMGHLVTIQLFVFHFVSDSHVNAHATRHAGMHCPFPRASTSHSRGDNVSVFMHLL